MRNAIRYAFTIILSLLLDAHFLRWGHAGLALTCTAFPVLLAFRRRWCSHVLSLFLLTGAVVWFRLTDLLVAQRIGMGAPWGRLALILGGVALMCVVGAVALHTARARERYSPGLQTAWAATAAFVLVFAVCGFLQARLRSPVSLLLERFGPD